MYLRLIRGGGTSEKCIKTLSVSKRIVRQLSGFFWQCCTTIKILSFHHIRILPSPANIFNNHLSACYDRILVYLAQLCCKRLGLPDEALEFILLFRLTAEYHNKTMYGTSTEFYNNLITSIYGVLQGSGLAAAIWLAVSLLLIKTYVQKFPTDGISNPTATNHVTKL